MASELAEIRKELEAIRAVCGTVQEVVGIRSEVDSITRTVGVVRELVDIRKEVESIRKEKDDIVKQFNANKSQEAPKEAPKAAEPKAEKKPEPKKEEPKKEEPKPVEKKPEPKKEEPKPKVEEKKPEPKKEEPKPVEKKPEPKKEAPKPKVEEAKPVEKKPEPKKEAPKPKVEEAKPKAAPVAAGQPPKDQQWGRGDLLSTCCEGYYNVVRDDSSDVNWVLLKHESNTKIRAEAVGTGGLSEVIPHLNEKDTAFIYMRFQTGDAESKRAKFVLFSWCGPRAPIMRKAKMSVHKGDVKQIFSSSALEIQASEVSDLDEAAVRASLIKAGGANYNGQNQ